jgi:hypothetical protein
MLRPGPQLDGLEVLVSDHPNVLTDPSADE